MGLRRNEENHKLLKSLEDYGIDGDSIQEKVKKLLESTEPGMDDVFLIETKHSDFPDSDRYPRMRRANFDGKGVGKHLATRRELLLSQLIGKPYPSYVIDTFENPNHDIYENTISDKIHDIDLHHADIYEGKIRGRKEEAKKSNPKFDEKRVIKFGYTIVGDGTSIQDGEVEVTKRELLKAGLDPEMSVEKHLSFGDIIRGKKRSERQSH